MILFWLLAVLLIVVALAFVLPPLIGTQRKQERVRELPAARIETYRSRVAALEEQNRAGALSDDDLREALDEIGRELLEEAPRPTAGHAAPVHGGGFRIWVAIAVGIGVPMLAIGFYQRLGAPQAVGADSQPVEMRAAQRSVEEMVAGLAARLESQPDDGGGWLLLARSYMALERYAQAFEAFSAARRLLDDDPALLADTAEAAALASGQDFRGVPADLLERALALDPAYPKALWLGAFAARQRGDSKLAVARWQALLDRQPADSQAAGVLRELIADAGGSAEAAPAAAPGAAGVAGAPALTVNVVLADGLAADIDGNETLFVFARAVNGPPMPLAVTRALARDLPLTVTLDDSMAMMAGRKLSDAGQVVVGARIAVSGTPTRASGDLQGFSTPVAPSREEPVQVVIDQKVP